ncbi:MAG TPA: Dyp-type peroxidase, partial [Polyangiaceae bacterium]|nr:Dyp-type peroxidase [Polyangiaceae bacterium]
WTRAHQIKTDLWYSAYRDVTNADLRTNAMVCEGLQGEMSEDQARGWLSLLAGGPAPNPDAAADSLGAVVPAIAGVKLATDDIQGIVLRGYGKHPRSCFVAVRFGHRAKAGAWIEALDVSAVDVGAGELRTNVAFTAAGLVALGLGPDTLGTFSREFQEGMSFGTRPRALGDEGESAPEKWRWGGTTAGSPAVHAIVLMYGTSLQALDARVASLRRALIEAGGTVIYERAAEMLPNRREHFGFADGIAQPAVMGFDDADAKDGQADLLAPGEFVFGYPNAYGMTPAAPTLAASDAAQGSVAAELRAAGALGENGTYLVVRQLHQRVADFRVFAQRASPILFPHEPPRTAAVRVMSSCVGRWPDGTPLALSPDPPAGPKDAGANAFAFADDPHGFRCPVTAHVRRANPRDSLGPTVEESKLVSNRHRILRRGRSYGEFLEGDKDDLAERGLFFVAVNANISRQFEFIQQTWIENRKFDGMRDDVDPLVGRPPEDGDATAFTVAEQPIRGRIVGMKAFVTLRGGGYFFAPGLRALRALAAIAKSGG